MAKVFRVDHPDHRIEPIEDGPVRAAQKRRNARADTAHTNPVRGEVRREDVAGADTLKSGLSRDPRGAAAEPTPDGADPVAAAKARRDKRAKDAWRK